MRLDGVGGLSRVWMESCCFFDIDELLYRGGIGACEVAKEGDDAVGAMNDDCVDRQLERDFILICTRGSMWLSFVVFAVVFRCCDALLS